MAFSRNDLLHIDDIRIVKRLQRGDSQAFDWFFEEFYDRLYRFSLHRLAGDVHAAEDAVQQALAKAIDSLATYRGEAQLQTWLFTICRNTITDVQRKQGLAARHVVLADDLPSTRAAVDSYCAPRSDDPQDKAENDEIKYYIHAALDRLPKHYGDALELKYIQGWSVLEIAEKLELGREATQSLIARAKRSFAEIYSELVATPELAPGIPGRLAP